MRTLTADIRTQFVVHLVLVDTHSPCVVKRSAALVTLVQWLLLFDQHILARLDRFDCMSRLVVDQLLLVLECLAANGANVILFVGMDLLVNVLQDAERIGTIGAEFALVQFKINGVIAPKVACSR